MAGACKGEGHTVTGEGSRAHRNTYIHTYTHMYADTPLTVLLRVPTRLLLVFNLCSISHLREHNTDAVCCHSHTCTNCKVRLQPTERG